MKIIIIVIVFIVVGILFLLGRPNDNALLGSIDTDLHYLSNAIRVYREKTGVYPSREKGLSVLVDRNVIPRLPLNPWGYNYNYVWHKKNNTTSISIISFGRDNKEGGKGLDGDKYVTVKGK